MWSKGFSLLLLISAEGFAPIQLGLGFTLTGVGGLLGVNRSVWVDALRSGIKNGTLGSILFPPDPIRNAAQIVSDMRNVFPAVKDRTVLGPMAVIGWGNTDDSDLGACVALGDTGTGAVDRAGAVVGNTAGGTSGAGAGADGCDRGDRLHPQRRRWTRRSTIRGFWGSR